MNTLSTAATAEVKDTKRLETSCLNSFDPFSLSLLAKQPLISFFSPFVLFKSIADFHPMPSIFAYQHQNGKTGNNNILTYLRPLPPFSLSCKLDDFHFVVNVFQCPSLTSSSSCRNYSCASERFAAIKDDGEILTMRTVLRCNTAAGVEKRH